MSNIRRQLSEADVHAYHLLLLTGTPTPGYQGPDGRFSLHVAHASRAVGGTPQVEIPRRQPSTSASSKHLAHLGVSSGHAEAPQDRLSAAVPRVQSLTGSRHTKRKRSVPHFGVGPAAAAPSQSPLAPTSSSPQSSPLSVSEPAVWVEIPRRRKSLLDSYTPLSSQTADQEGARQSPARERNLQGIAAASRHVRVASSNHEANRAPETARSASPRHNWGLSPQDSPVAQRDRLAQLSARAHATSSDNSTGTCLRDAQAHFSRSEVLVPDRREPKKQRSNSRVSMKTTIELSPSRARSDHVTAAVTPTGPNTRTPAAAIVAGLKKRPCRISDADVHQFHVLAATAGVSSSVPQPQTTIAKSGVPGGPDLGLSTPHDNYRLPRSRTLPSQTRPLAGQVNTLREPSIPGAPSIPPPHGASTASSSTMGWVSSAATSTSVSHTRSPLSRIPDGVPRSSLGPSARSFHGRAEGASSREHRRISDSDVLFFRATHPSRPASVQPAQVQPAMGPPAPSFAGLGLPGPDSSPPPRPSRSSSASVSDILASSPASNFSFLVPSSPPVRSAALQSTPPVPIRSTPSRLSEGFAILARLGISPRTGAASEAAPTHTDVDESRSGPRWTVQS